jgi:large subunit ribosomal protein L22
MTGPKLNEGSRIAGERIGTRASARYVRMSASKARVVLDLIRGLPVRKADEVLQFTEREAARVIRKVLASAVANAVENDAQDAEELYVHACFADEGPTLRRFKPRARGRATRIRKRTTHITIIVARMSDERLAIEQARAEGGGRATGAAAARRARVERSRQRAAQRRQGGAAQQADEAVQPADAGESPDSVDSRDSVDSVDSPESVDSVDSPEETSVEETNGDSTDDSTESGESAEEKN